MDLELGQEMVLGHLSEAQHLAQLETYALHPDDQSPCFAVWRIASYVWSEPSIGEMSPVVTQAAPGREWPVLTW